MTPVSGSRSISRSILAKTSASWVLSTFRRKLHSLQPLQEEQAGAGFTPSSSASMKPIEGPARVSRKKFWTGRRGGGAASEARRTSEENLGAGAAREEEKPVNTQPGEKPVRQRRRSPCSSPSVEWSRRSFIPSMRCTAPLGRLKAAAAAGGASGNSWARVDTSGAACTSVKLFMPMASSLWATSAMSSTSRW